MTATATKLRPILMSGPMVRAILDGRKTQTRRVVKPQPPADIEEAFAWFAGELRGAPNGCAEDGLYVRTLAGLTYRGPCPYGAPGDVLWVRESWYYDLPPHKLPKVRPADFDRDSLYFRADGECCAQIPECQCAEVGKPKWKPSTHLPRWACRLFLRVKSVRVERVQEIGEADAKAEGVERHDDEGVTYYGPLNAGHADARRAFETLWDSINAERGFGWAANPWVWVVEFERTEKPSRLRRDGE